MKVLKTIFLITILTIITICAFGGGCLIWSLFVAIVQPNITPQTNEIMFFISALAPIPFCWWIAPKIDDKIN